MRTKTLTDENYNEKKALDYDSSRLEEVDKSSKRAWLVAYISLAITVMLGIAIIFLTPLKTVELMVVKVDKNGFVEIITQLDEEVISTDEAIDKSFIYKYVKAREQYYFDTLNQDFEIVQMFSAPAVQKKYVETMTNKETGKATVLKDKKTIEVKVLSISISKKHNEIIATVRIETIKKDKNSDSGKPETEIKVITLTYDYLPIKQKASLRLENPLGFVVNEYRIDEEIAE